MILNTDLDEYSEDMDVHLARRARSGSLSDQDLMQDVESHSGVEEAGYEVGFPFAKAVLVFHWVFCKKTLKAEL